MSIKPTGRKGDAKYLVEIIAVVAALVIILVVIWPVLKTALFDTGQQGVCNWSFLVSKFGAKVFQDIPPACQAHRFSVTPALLQQQIPLAEKAIKNYQKTLNIPANQWFSEQNKAEWALDSIMARELVDCSDKVLRGKFTLFQGGWITSKTACVICARVTFDNTLPFQELRLTQGQIGSLDTWLKVNNYKGSTYYDYLSEGFKTKPVYTQFVYSPKIPYAVIYWESNPSSWKQVKEVVGNNQWTGVAINAATLALVVIPSPAWIPIVGRVAVIALRTAQATGVVASVITTSAAGARQVELTAETLGIIGEGFAQESIAYASKELKEGNSAQAILLTPYNGNLIKPIEQGGLGCEQFVD
ncbi:MAG TPA: hypothetical protein VJJ82_04390 [Candidatus Nanoarchaeia archaeon]|nr:hypothetical protein [Candidatus Nanoarchaeia archaeon]